MVSAKHVSKIYGKGESSFTALDDVSVDIPSGASVAIIGKSGSGKSTLMHIMSGLDHPTSGEIVIGGQKLGGMKARAMDEFRASEMSFVFQAFFVEANQTCYDNVMLPLEIADVPQRKRRAMVVEALRAVDLEPKIDSLAGNLSGGQKQRLAIARAIVAKPKLIFADEPTGNLDSATGDLIMQLLFHLNKSLGCTLIIVTHDPDIASRCELQIQMSDGRISSANRVSARPLTARAISAPNHMPRRVRL